MDKKYKFTANFTSKLNPIISTDLDKYIALASERDFRKFIPKEIDFDKKVDFLGFAGEAFFANRLNRNGHGVRAKEAVEMAKLIPYSLINIDHSRKNCVGVITKATLTEYGTGREISEEEALKMTSPFTVVVGGVIWRVANPALATAIEESAAEDESKFFLSWEVAFDEYDLIKLDAKKYNFEDGEMITDEKEIEEIEASIKEKKTSGVKYGLVASGGVIPLGCGIVETPAATVEAISVTESNVKLEIREEEASLNEEKLEISSQIEKVDVKEISKIMKIKALQDITNEALEKKEIVASQITDFIESQIKQESEKWVAEKTQKEQEIKAAKEAQEALNKEIEASRSEIDTLKKQLSEIKAEQEKAAQIEKFNQRMAALDDKYVLDDEARKAVASQIKDVSDEEYTKFETSFAVLMKDKTKEAVAALKEKKEKEKAEIIASETVTEIVEGAIEKSKKETVVAGTAKPELTLKDKYAKAFSKENWTIDTSRRKK